MDCLNVRENVIDGFCRQNSFYTAFVVKSQMEHLATTKDLECCELMNIMKVKLISLFIYLFWFDGKSSCLKTF